MSDVKLNQNDFAFHFKDAPELGVLPDGFDPVNDLYEFNVSAGQLAYKENASGYSQPVRDDNGDGQQFEFYQAVADQQGGFAARSNLCLGAFTHTSYRVGRFGEIFEAKWVMQREGEGSVRSYLKDDGSVKSYLKDYEADQDERGNGLSIAPEDLGRVFKGEEFTKAMTTFHNDHIACLRELGRALKNPDYFREHSPLVLGDLAAAISQNDLAKAFALLYKPEFIENNLELIKKTIKLHLYLESGLWLNKANPASYKMDAPHKIKKDLRMTYRFFGGITKRSGEKQASQVKDRLTDTSVLNTLVMKLLGNPEFYALLTQTPGVSESIVDTPASDSETSLATPPSDNTDDVDGPSDLSPEVRAVLEASSGAPVGRHDDVDGVRESRSGDALASPTNSPDPVSTTAPASDPSSTTDSPPPVTAAAACQIQDNLIILSAKSNINFDTGTDTLTDASKTALRELTQFLKDHPDLQNIHINGHTDNVGNDEKNMDLSNRRAVAVLRFLVNEGVDPNRLTATGYGETMPSDTNRTSAGRTNNRRVEFVIVEAGADSDEEPPVSDTAAGTKTDAAEGGAPKRSRGARTARTKADLDRQIAESTGLLADLNQMTDNPIFGTGGLDSSVSDALGGLIGSQYGNQYGSGGLGSRGSGFGGGGTAAGLGGLGTRGSGLGASGYGRGTGATGLTFTDQKAKFQITETAPEFAFTGDATQIASVTNGFNKKPLSFTTQGGKLVVTGLQGYSKTVIQRFKDNDVLLDDNAAKDQARMSYPIVVTLTDGSVVKLFAEGE